MKDHSDRKAAKASYYQIKFLLPPFQNFSQDCRYLSDWGAAVIFHPVQTWSQSMFDPDKNQA